MNVREKMRASQKEWAEEKKILHKEQEEEKSKRQEFQTAWKEAIYNKSKYNKNKYKNQIFSKYKRPNKEDFLEINSGEILVETARFIPISEQVRRFERAGLNLKTEMSKLYDYGPIADESEGFREEALQMYPDNIEGFDMLQDAQIAALKEAKRRKDAAEKDLEVEGIHPDNKPPTEPPAEPPSGNDGEPT